MTRPRVLTPPTKPNIGRLSAITRQTVKTIIFGDSGVGKTSLLVTAPRPLLVVNVDNSIASLPTDVDGIDVYPNPELGRPVETWEEFTEFIEWLMRTGAKEYETVAIDTATEAGEKLLKTHILSNKGPTGRVHPLVMSQADYGLYAELFLEQLRRLRDLPCNVVINCQTQDLVIDDPSGATELYRFAAFGGKKTPETAPALFDIVGYLGVVEDEDTEELVRRLLLQPVNNRRAKIRTKHGVKAPLVVNSPNLTELFKLVTGTGTNNKN